MLTQHLLQKKETQSKVVHNGIVCDGCETNPITGIRYKCVVRGDYDLCEKCELRLQPLPHPMLKIRTPQLAPVSVQCEFDTKCGRDQPKAE
jgi:hypothetical protein